MLLYQEDDGFLFNSDSHYLYDFIAKLNPKGDLLDIGSGCGILGLLIARDFKVDLTSIDIQENSTFLTSQNAKVNHIKCEALCGDFLEYEFGKKFDYIVSNPPYYSSDVIKSENKKLFISRYEDNLELEKFIKKVKTLLKPRGHFIFCHDGKKIDVIFSLLSKNKLKPIGIRFVYGSDTKSSHLVFVHARSSSNSPVKIYPPLIATQNGKFSDEVVAIYQKTSTHSIKCKLC